MESLKKIIGRNVYVDLIGYAKQVPAKVDTGADSSSIWASNVLVLPDGKLQFTLFDEGSLFYDGKLIETLDYSVSLVRSSTGHEEIRYRVRLPVRVKGLRIKAAFNLSNRSHNQFPILIGRRMLNNKFTVDVTMADDDSKLKTGRRQALIDELTNDPFAFYKKYHGRDL
jgi:hypothetical protein